MVARSEETLSVRSSGSPVATQLQRIAEKARKAPGFQFTSLYHLVNEELLRGCFQRLRKDAASWHRLSSLANSICYREAGCSAFTRAKVALQVFFMPRW